MIVPMNKVFVVGSAPQRDELLEALGSMGVLHITPVVPAEAIPDEATTDTIATARRAIQILASVEPGEAAADATALECAHEAVAIDKRSSELTARLTALHREAEQMEVWGDVGLDQFDRLRQGGLHVQLAVISAELLQEIHADLVHTIRELPGKRVLAGIVNRAEPPELPATAIPVELPRRDRPSIRAEAKDVDAQLRTDAQHLCALAHRAGDVEKLLASLQQQAVITAAQRSALADEKLFALQGWIPQQHASELGPQLQAQGLASAVRISDPSEDEHPPTLIRYPRWAQPIKGLFDILGTLPGYRECDLSPFFMIALPLFAAMLIGDAGYGLVFTIAGLIFYGKLAASAGKATTHLLLVIGLATLIWGILTANYFGLTPDSFASAGGFVKTLEGVTTPDVEAMSAGSGGFAAVGKAMMSAAPIYRSDPKAVQTLLMKIAFIIGAIHLTMAQLRKAVAEAPNLQFLASVGWAIFLWGMLGMIWYLMFDKIENANWMLCGPPLAVGYAMVLAFSSTSRNPLKRVLSGFASSLLPALGAFSDTMSYIRLMAVGLASYYIAAAFNGLGAKLADTITWYSVLPVLVVLFGHALNIGLAMIAIFAHGVRLNMLEFSNNAGVQWAGYAYSPFQCSAGKET